MFKTIASKSRQHKLMCSYFDPAVGTVVDVVDASVTAVISAVGAVDVSGVVIVGSVLDGD